MMTMTTSSGMVVVTYGDCNGDGGTGFGGAGDNDGHDDDE